MSETVLEVKHLSLSFQTFSGRVQAVRDVNFSLHQGETLALVGESGCGKTTTGRMLVRLLEMTSGSVEFDGQSIAALRGRAELLRFRKNAQIIFQDPYASLDPRKKVCDIIAEGIDVHRMAKGRRDREEQVARLLSSVGLRPEHLLRYPHEFSGGQRQRIGNARALATRPRFVVCDEPSLRRLRRAHLRAGRLHSGADRQSPSRSQQKEQLTYLFIAHDLSLVKYISDRIAVMYRGRIVEMGDAEEIYSHPLHPYTRSLVSAIPLPDLQSERLHRRIPYVPDEERNDRTLREVGPGHFVYAAPDERYE